MFVGPGTMTFSHEWVFYFHAVRATVRALHRQHAFDVIHAHFTYPDGVVAALLGRRYDVPVVVTEHNSWIPWIHSYPRVQQRSVWAVRQSARHIAVSRSIRTTIESFVGPADNLTVVPNGIDGSQFTLGPDTRDPNQLVFVGAVRPVKGVDILLKALRILLNRGRRSVHLVLVGEAFYGPYQREELRLKQLAHELGVTDRIRFAGKQMPPELVETIRRSALLVLPSRIESFGTVLVEALACGTPVVATRCGGPEDIVNDAVGVLVPTEDPEALARGIEHVLDRRDGYDPRQLRAHALEHFGIESVGQRLLQVYEDVLGRHRARTRTPSPALAGSVTT
jgi:glycosyltransferase involved in cell wall biosynthesis